MRRIHTTREPPEWRPCFQPTVQSGLVGSSTLPILRKRCSIQTWLDLPCQSLNHFQVYLHPSTTATSETYTTVFCTFLSDLMHHLSSECQSALFKKNHFPLSETRTTSQTCCSVLLNLPFAILVECHLCPIPTLTLSRSR